MKMRSVVPMRIAKYGYVLVSVALCALGAVVWLGSAAPGAAVGSTLGALLAAFGAVKLVGYFSKDLFRLAFQYDLQFGVLFCVFGAITLLHPDSMMTLLGVAFGMVILSDGLFKLKTALEAKAFGIRCWWLILSLAVLTGFFGAALVYGTEVSLRTPTAWWGISLIGEGVLNLCVAVSLVKIVHHQIPDRPEPIYDEPEEDR